MKKIVILAALALFLISCAHGKTEHFPAGADSADAAEVFIIRNNNLLGLGISLKVYLDDTMIVRLRAGEYISFFVESGFHSVGTSNTQVTFPGREGQKHYFLISADLSQFGFEIERISNSKGENWLTKTKPLK
jgi:hypothetical protein